MFSLVQTAKGNGLKQEEYIRNLFEQAPYCKNKEGGRGDIVKQIKMTVMKINGIFTLSRSKFKTKKLF